MKRRVMKRLVFLLLFLVSSNGTEYNGECKSQRALVPRPHSVSVSEFGAIGDGVTINTVAFQNAIFYLKSFADKGGAQLYVPAGIWLIGCINLTSHLTLFLEKDAVILGSKDNSHWDVIEALPSYGQGLEHISVGYDAVALKSGWDEYGIEYGRPTTNVHVRRVRLQSFSGSGITFGSEMSGGISNTLVQHMHVHGSKIGIELKTAVGRDGYIKDIFISNALMEYVGQGIKATGHCKSHPDGSFDPMALPVVTDITFRDIVGLNITTPGYFLGLDGSPFTSICLSNVSFYLSSNASGSWRCLNVLGSSVDVLPEP